MKARKGKFLRILFLLCALFLLVSSCTAQPLENKFQAFVNWLGDHGYSSTYTPLADSGNEVDVPIFNETVWYLFALEGGEELLVYFDTSNRAKQLAEQFCSNPSYGKTAAFGLRFIVNYRGNDEGVLSLLEEIAAV